MSCLFLVTDREFNHPIQQTTQNKSEYQQENRIILANLSWAQPTYSALLLIPQMHVPYKCGTIKKGNKQAFQRYKIYCQEALLQQRNNLPNTNVLTFCAMFKCDVRFFESYREIYSVAMSVIGQCQTSAILLNNQNAKFNNGLTINMLSQIM